MKRIILFIIGGLFCFSTSAMASGFGVFVQGAEGLAQGNAVIAHTAGASSVYFNPALMPQLETHAGLEIGTTVVQSDRSFTSDLTGLTTDANDSTYFPSTFYYYRQLPKYDSLWFGSAVNSPFGLGTDWPSEWEGRYIATKNEITTFNINPNIAWAINEDWSVAFGLDFLYLDINSNRALPSSLLAAGAPDAYQHITGDTWALGGNAAVAWTPSEKLSLGLSYRTNYTVSLDDMDVTHTDVIPPLAALIPNTKASTKFKLPQQLTFGVSYNFTPNLIVEVSARWEDWSQYGDMTIYLEDAVIASTEETILRDWESTIAYSIGGKYNITPKWAVMAGFLYSETCVPDYTFDPSIPDTDAYLYTIGGSYEGEKWDFDLSYGLQDHEDRNKNNDINGSYPDTLGFEANGKYEGVIHLLAASVGYNF